MLITTNDREDFYAIEYDIAIQGGYLCSIDEMFTYYGCDSIEVIRDTDVEVVWINMIKDDKILDLVTMTLGERSPWKFYKAFQRVVKYTIKKYGMVNMKCAIHNKASMLWLMRLAKKLKLNIKYDSKEMEIHFFTEEVNNGK